MLLLIAMDYLKDVDIEALVSDRVAFDSFVYTPLEEAIAELQKRWSNGNILSPTNLPSILMPKPRAILYVSVITPNHQIRRYVDMAKAFDLEPLVFEQIKDKFTSNNSWKHSLGRMRFFLGKNKNGGSIIERLNVVDFANYDGKYISSVKTLWGQSLVDFHHDMFCEAFPSLSIGVNVFDGSDWFKENGSNPGAYYVAFMSLLIKNGIQFENFMLDGKERAFTKDIFLPSFIEVYKRTGYKPLIVALQPTDIETDEFWISYPYEERARVVGMINSNK